MPAGIKAKSIMPELPEVETVRRGLQPFMEGKRIAKVTQNRPDLRFPFPEKLNEQLSGRQILSLGRRAKYLTITMEGDLTAISHLGMSGSYRIEAANADHLPGQFAHDRSKKEVHDHLILHLTDSDSKQHDENTLTRIIYNDPRRFGFFLLTKTSELNENRFLKDLGIEPTGNSLSGDLLRTLFNGRKAPLKAALLDQRLIAGLGNIYVCEALWRAGLSPVRAAGSAASMDEGVLNNLSDAIRQVIQDAIAAGGSSLKDHRQADGSLGYFQHSFSVYGREGQPCRREGCGGIIERITQSGRSTFFCASCQH